MLRTSVDVSYNYKEDNFEIPLLKKLESML